MDNLPKRKPNRLKHWDYNTNGGYFITICVEHRKQILSRICVGDGSPVPQLTDIGHIVEDYIKNLNSKYPCLTVSEYVVMPNHIHLLLFIENDGTGNPSPTVGNIIGWLKYNTTKSVNEKYNTAGRKLWQRSYYDHIIRDERDYVKKRNYILTNPSKWADDEYYS